MIFIGINVGVFVLMCLAGGFAVTSPDPKLLIGFGAKQNALIAGQHQYWRLITSMFIHVGVIHLLLNNYALWIIGQEIERIYGSSRFVILYLLTGLLGSLGSYAFNPQATSAGASGAIFGLFGVMATFAFKYRAEIPELLSREIKRRIIPIIAINLVFGFSVRIVDNAAHVGGLVSGIALALAVHYKRPSERITPLAWRVLQIGCLALILVSFVHAFRNYDGPPLRFSNLTARPGASVITYFEGMKEADRALRESMKAATSPGRDKTSATDAVERGIRALAEVHQSDSEADRYRERLLGLLTEQKNILSDPAQSDNRNMLRRREDALADRYNQFQTEYSRWLPGFLNAHGYELESADR